MAVTRIQLNNKGIKFQRRIIREFVRGNMFSPYMGNDAGAVIRQYYEEGNYGGDVINVPIVKALRGKGKGNGVLVGNEEEIDNYGWRAWIGWARNAVKATKAERKKGSFDLFGQARDLLSEWGRSMQRDELVQAMFAIPSESPPAGLDSEDGQRVNGILFENASNAQRTTWMNANDDRVLFGSLNSNFASASFATSVANVDATSDRASAAIVRLMKSKAKLSDPKIEPLTTDDGYERYVLFVGSLAFADLEADPQIYQANKDARPREGRSYKDNPIFMDGDLLYNGVIIREVPEIDKLNTLVGAGNGGANVAPVFLCGRSALGLVWGQLPEPHTLDETDYQFREGVGIDMAYGAGKIFFKDRNTGDLVDWGVVTAFVATVEAA